MSARVYDLAPRLAARRATERAPRGRPWPLLALDAAALTLFAAGLAFGAWRQHWRRRR